MPGYTGLVRERRAHSIGDNELSTGQLQITEFGRVYFNLYCSLSDLPDL